MPSYSLTSLFSAREHAVTTRFKSEGDFAALRYHINRLRQAADYYDGKAHSFGAASVEYGVAVLLKSMVKHVDDAISQFNQDTSVTPKALVINLRKKLSHGYNGVDKTPLWDFDSKHFNLLSPTLMPLVPVTGATAYLTYQLFSLIASHTDDSALGWTAAQALKTLALCAMPFEFNAGLNVLDGLGLIYTWDPLFVVTGLTEAVDLAEKNFELADRLATTQPGQR